MRTLAVLILALVGTPWAWPVPPPVAIERPYVAPATAYGAGHRGIDLAAPDGQATAPADGVVSFVGFVVDRPVLSIRHPGGVVSSYEPLQTTLAAGDRVRRGDPIGTVLPGHCERVCLHLGVRIDGQYVSPLLLLDEPPRSVLLPTRRIGERRGPAAAPGPSRRATPLSAPRRAGGRPAVGQPAPS